MTLHESFIEHMTRWSSKRDKEWFTTPACHAKSGNNKNVQLQRSKAGRKEDRQAGRKKRLYGRDHAQTLIALMEWAARVLHIHKYTGGRSGETMHAQPPIHTHLEDLCEVRHWLQVHLT